MFKTLIAASLALLSAPAWAQSGPGHSHSGHSEGPMTAYMTTMDGMMDAMGEMTSSGNADADFLLMMIPHHQSAIDMARVELAHGTDDETRRLAQQIIDAQEREIAEMRAMLSRLGVEGPQ